jgi:L-lactate dehydrogenase complex protein LldG
MSQARQQILARIRSGLKRGPLSPHQQTTLQQQLESPQRTLQPARAKVTGQAAIDDFKAMALESAAELIQLDSLDQLPAQLAALMQQANISQQPLVLADESNLRSLNWASAGINTELRVAQNGDAISLTNSLCGVAETGTLVLHSSPNSPTSLNFLPDIHCLVLQQENIVAGYEDAWDRVRDGAKSGTMPRTVNFITGPSRSADLEQTLRMGAHGPKRLVVFLL